jgi:hypothetical protein
MMNGLGFMLRLVSIRPAWAAVFYCLLTCIAGCQSGMLAGPRFVDRPQSDVILAGDFGDANDDEDDDNPPPTPPKKSYTAPGATARKLSFLGSLASGQGTSANIATSVAADASQSAVGRGSLQGSVQTMGPMGGSLGGPVVVQAVGKTGLLQGGALGGGFINNNIFMAGQRSFTQGCQSLINAGFFSNQQACQAAVRP